MSKINIIASDKFQKEFKKLLKKYGSLEEDLQKVIRLLEEIPIGDNSKHWVTLKKEGEKVMMKKRMMCRSVRGAQFRLIYYYDGEVLELEFIEIYFKGNKENEDKKRIEDFWKEKTQ